MMRRIVSLVMMVIGLALAGPGLVAAAPAPSGPTGVHSTLEQYRQWIHEARLKYPYPASEDKMVRVMLCESGGDRLAVGGGHRWYGLFQYVPGTWRGAWNPYRTSDIFDAKAQIFATAKAWSLGKQNEWSCYHLTR